MKSKIVQFYDKNFYDKKIFQFVILLIKFV